MDGGGGGGGTVPPGGKGGGGGGDTKDGSGGHGGGDGSLLLTQVLCPEFVTLCISSPAFISASSSLLLLVEIPVENLLIFACIVADGLFPPELPGFGFADRPPNIFVS